MEKRKPAAAFFSLISLICAIGLALALCIGYIQTSKALKLARKNAATADATLTKVFSYVESQPPSTSGSVLLDTLMPYFQEISQQRNIPEAKIIQANKIVGLYAMRSGNYELAEKSYRRLSELSNDAYSLNLLADSLDNQRKTKEANNIRSQVINKYSKSKNATDRYEVVKALQTFTDNPQNEYLAFEIIKSLLKEEPENPDYLYRYASIIGNNPRIFSSERIAGVEPNAIVILNNLAKEYPDNPEYGIAIVELMSKKLHYNTNLNSRDLYNLNMALDLSDRLLGRFPNTPKVVSSVAELKNAHIRMLRHNGEMAKARKETENLLGMLELLFYNKETPDSAKECLIDLQFERLRMLSRVNRQDVMADTISKIRKELLSYNGKRLREFQQRLDSMSY